MEVEQNSCPDSNNESQARCITGNENSTILSLKMDEETSEFEETMGGDYEREKTSEIQPCSKSLDNCETSMEFPNNESARSKLISEALQKEDEFLEYLMSLPAVASGTKEKVGTKETQAHPPTLLRSTSTYGGNAGSGSGVKVGLDHLDNLCKLMEQLGDLREQNSKLQRRVQYLEDLKNLQEMHKQLQEETQRNEDPSLRPMHKHRYSSMNTGEKHNKRANIGGNYSGAVMSKLEDSEESLTNNKTSQNTANQKRNIKCKTASNSRIRQSLLRCQQRERSRSVGIDELKGETKFHSDAGKQRQAQHPQRRSVAGIGATNKSKVSKWTKVKEAFRWEKAAVPETQDLQVEEVHYLRVPSSGDGDSSSACSSGHSPFGEYSLPIAGTLSSSSSSDDFDIELNFADILAEFGPQRSASATDSTGGRLLVQDARRLSLTQMPEEEDASRRSKSLDGDATIGGALINRHFSGKEGKCKAHKTPWGKVKDIIQTRKDSLKKRHRKADTGAISDHDDEAEPTSLVDAADVDDVMCKSKTQPEGFDSPGRENKRHSTKMSTPSPGSADSKASRRLTPMLTLTLPSSEELRSLPGTPAPLAITTVVTTTTTTTTTSSKPPPSPQTEDRLHKTSTSSAPGGTAIKGVSDDAVVSKADSYRRQVSISRPASNSAGTSPPVHRRASKWTKVKKAFLTSAPGRREDEASGRISSSVPSSPNRNSSFLYEVDGDEVDSGDADETQSQEATNVQAEIQRNYEELQQKLSQEFHKKLHEWERMKCPSSSSVPSTGCGRGSGGSGDEGFLHHDKVFRRKMEEWERIKSSQGHAGGSVKNRDSMALQPLDDNLSPDFRKKLQEWEKMKKTIPSAGREEGPVPPHFRRRIAEWQLWRTKEPSEECSRRTQQEWQRMRTVSGGSAADSGLPEATDRSNGSGGQSPSPGISRKGASRKDPGRGRSPDQGIRENTAKAPAANAKSQHKGKIQKEKELQWLDKELQKIEREKQRLEREREKYLEREARLEKMRRAMGSGSQKEEVLIQTSTGFFRFQGISEKFTKRLYEWEKARGIRPEASTFALLDPGYKPQLVAAIKGTPDGGGTVGLSRSKSASSVTNISGAGTSSSTITHQPSSLSLNDVEVLGQVETTPMEESRAASEPHLHASSTNDDEPAAVIVDVEDVVVETAAPLAATPAVESQTPVYCYAPEEVTRLIDSSGSDSEGKGQVERTDSVRTEASYKLLDENMSLLTRLRVQEDICRKIENEIEDLEGKLEDAAKTQEIEIEKLRRQETDMSNEVTEPEERGKPRSEEIIARLRSRICELERRQERLRREGTTLQDTFAQHSRQQAALAQDLVGNMKQLQAQGAVALMQELSSQLLALSEKLEVALAERSREIHSLRFELQDRRREMSQSCGSLTDSVNGRLPRQSSEELSQLPALLTAKVLELKRGLSSLCTPADVPVSEAWHTSGADEGSTATFVLRMTTKGRHRASENDVPEVIQVDSEGNTSPVACVTIVPPFLRRSNEASRPESYHSVLSSGTSSVCDEDEEDDRIIKDRYDDSEEEKRNTNISKTIRNSSDIEDSLDDSDHDDSDEENDKTDYSTGTTINKNTREQSTSKDSLQKDDVNLRGSCPDTESNESYETEVLPSTKSNVSSGRMRKLLRTRRISDTHVGYSSKDDRKSSFDRSGKRLSNDIDDNSDDEINVKVTDTPKRSPKFRRDSSRNSRSTGEETTCDDNNRTVERQPQQLTPTVAGREYSAATVDDAKLPASDGSRQLSILTQDDETAEESNNVSTPPNVFVKTTRKIFSPVRRDSKGKASSVISYIVGESLPKCGSSTPAEASSEKFGGFRSTYSPVSNSRWRQRERGESCTNDDAPPSMSPSVPPSWMLRRSRSQSSSPAMTRRGEEGSYSDEQSRSGSYNNTNRKVSDNLNESTDTSSTSQDESKGNVLKPSSKQLMVKIGADIRLDSSSEKNDKFDGPSPSSCPATPGFPPLPQSPSPGRRDLIKMSAKETAPSIRMMIAKYNQKLTEQEGGGGRSPEIGGSGSGSPVAWRSPVAERRVKAQMEKYQEEVRRVLQHGANKSSTNTTLGTIEVQKSASAGIIRAPVPSNCHKTPEHKGQEDAALDIVTDKPPSFVQRRGILKSSSAGCIKPVTSQSKIPTLCKMPEDGGKTSILPPPEPFQDGLPGRSDGKPPSPRFVVTPTPSSPSSPEMGGKHSSPPLSRLRALKLKRAKEEFLTRGPGGQSWTSEDTPSASVSPEPFEDIVMGRDNSSRLSQVSVGSESSFDSSLIIANKDQLRSDEERLLLVKSASAGMINVDPSTYRRFSAGRSPPASGGSFPRSVTEPNSGTTTPKSSKFGISSIASKFRKVKMRRNREKDASRMNAVSTLCRQSLLVDIHMSKCDADKQEEASTGTSSKSCPSSPVLQRSPPRAKTEESSTSWIRNPARKIFKPK